MASPAAVSAEAAFPEEDPEAEAVERGKSRILRNVDNERGLYGHTGKEYLFYANEKRTASRIAEH